MRLEARIVAAHAWGPRGADVPLTAARASFLAPEPVRPEAVAAGVWRRASRISRLAIAAVAPAAAHLDAHTPLLFGTGVGEFASTASFLETLFRKGQAGASPLAFQNAVHNAPASHLAMAFGLRGPCETLCAGPGTSFAVLERALVALRVRGERVLVVLADECGSAVAAGLGYTGLALGEGAAAFVLDAEPGGARLVMDDGPPPDEAWSRRASWPGEAARESVRAHEAHLGMSQVVDGLALVGLFYEGGGAIVDGPRVVRIVR